MEEQLKTQLVEAGIDVDSALERLMGKEALLERFLKKFNDDLSFQQLGAAIEAGNVQDAFAASHTLKGLSGNLSMTDLREAVSRQTECFRAGNLEEGAAIMPEVAREYERVTAAIRKCFP